VGFGLYVDFDRVERALLPAAFGVAFVLDLLACAKVTLRNMSVADL
jgi:hypothetical protein